MILKTIIREFILTELKPTETITSPQFTSSSDNVHHRNKKMHFIKVVCCYSHHVMCGVCVGI